MFAKSIIERLKSYFNVKTDVELAKILHESQPTLAKWKKRNSIDIQHILPYLPIDLDLNWLIRGESLLKNEWIAAEPEVKYNANLAINSEHE